MSQYILPYILFYFILGQHLAMQSRLASNSQSYCLRYQIARVQAGTIIQFLFMLLTSLLTHSVCSESRYGWRTWLGLRGLSQEREQISGTTSLVLRVQSQNVWTDCIIAQCLPSTNKALGLESPTPRKRKASQVYSLPWSLLSMIYHLNKSTDSCELHVWSPKPSQQLT